MHLNDRDKRDSIIYDPKIKGFDSSFFATLSGTPTVSSGNLRFNNASVSSYLQFEFIEMLNFMVTVPAVPTSGDARRFGLFAPATANIGALYFDITDTTFSAKCIDSSGNIQTQTITWVGAWTANPIVYGIAWEQNRVQFWVNGAIVATFSVTSGSPGAAIPFTSLPLYIKNTNADNMDVAYIDIRHAAGIN